MDDVEIRPDEFKDMMQEMMTVLVVMFRNFDRQKSQKITFKIPDELRTQMNFRAPETEVPCLVAAQTDKTFWKFSKLRPMADWGPLENIEIIVDG